MMCIAHRANLDGPNKATENSPEQIELALSEGFDVEIDVWWTDEKWFLGHDAPQHEVVTSFLKKRGLWCHAKNHGALERLIKMDVCTFWHQEDDRTLTTKNDVWTYPKKELIKNSVCVIPEADKEQPLPFDKVKAVCTDYPRLYKQAPKVAVLIVGLLRTFTVCAKSVINNILHANGACDVFVYSSSVGIENANDVKLTLQNLVNPINIRFVEDDANDVREEKLFRYKLDRKIPRATDRASGIQWHKVWRCWEMMRNHEETRGEKYNVVIKIRPDTIFHKQFSRFNYDLEKRCIYNWEDIVAIGSREPMEHYCNLYHSYGEYKWDDEVNRKILGYTDQNLTYISEMQMKRHMLAGGFGLSWFELVPWLDVNIVRVAKDVPAGQHVPDWLPSSRLLTEN